MDNHDKSFFDELYVNYYLYLFGYAKSIVVSDALAEEIVHEAFLILLAEQDNLQHHSNILAWLVTVVRNQSFNELRERKTHVTVSLDEVPPIAAEPQEMVSFQDSLPKDLKPADRQLLTWRYEERMDYEEIAKRLGRSYDATRAQMYRAKKRCAKLMKRERKKMGL